MKQPMRTEAVKRFLEARTHPDLAALYSRSMECQVNVGQDGGTRVDGEWMGVPWQAWTDGMTKWKSFRIPYNAATEPTFEDKSMSFDLEAHAEGIGMTGWDWESKVSRWVGFDFDSIVGHADGHRKALTAEELDRVQQAACAVPWVTVRKSTAGKGRHLHAFLEPVETKTHTEHAAVGRAILGKLSAITGFDFDSKVDSCGGNMWVWHRKMKGTDGLVLIKSQTELATVPINWRDHVRVVSGRKRRMAAPNTSESTEPKDADEQMFDDLAAQHPQTTLDSEHQKFLAWILDPANTGTKQAWWDGDRRMLVCHTHTLKEAHQILGLRGVFETASSGSSEQNAYAFPIRRGGWVVRRFGPGVGEASTWGQDQSGFTRCFLNREPDLATAARSNEGIEDEKRIFHFVDLTAAISAARLLGVNFEAPSWPGRGTSMKQTSDGRLIISFERKESDPIPAPGWLAKKERWQRVFEIRQTPDEGAAAEGTGVYDDVVRHISNDAEDCGWVIRHEDSQWKGNPLSHVKPYLKAQGLSAKEVEIVIGRSVAKSWTLVNAPFQDEYLGNRKWNRHAAQLAFVPKQTDLDSLSYPHWSRVLRHCGNSLNPAVEMSEWCQANAILTGSDYLMAWIAAMFQHPLEPLPYLFFWSEEQNTGKSIFHEALGSLITRGYIRADNALINQSGFNAELRTAILCAVEEIDLSSSKAMAYNRIKDWVTAKQLSIHAKGETPYQIANSTHWIQAANDLSFCPVFPGDTRIVVIRVPPLAKNDEIPKGLLLDELKKEAPDFLGAVMRIQLPRPVSRLYIPVLETADKVSATQANESAVQAFIRENLYECAGSMIKYSELWSMFQARCDPSEVGNWTIVRFGREIPARYPRARRHKDAQLYVGNLSVEPNTSPSVNLIIRKDFNGNNWLEPESGPAEKITA